MYKLYIYINYKLIGGFMRKKTIGLVVILLLISLLMLVCVACEEENKDSINVDSPNSNIADNSSHVDNLSNCQHEWINATCVSAKRCSICNSEEGLALGHDLISHAPQDASCISVGWSSYDTCSRCDYSTYHEYPIIPHRYFEYITTYATCNSDGVKSFVCGNCGDKYYENYSLEKYSAEDLFEIANKCTVEIITYDRNGDELALGSGFVYSSNGEIVTNYHVIEEALSAKVYFGEIGYDVISVLGYDVSIDIAILKINASNLPRLDICTKLMNTGATVYALGSSKGLTSTFSKGIITTANREMDEVSYIQHDAAISRGNSGGPLINEYGEIIGINTLTIRDSQNLNFAISVSEISNISKNKVLTLEEVYNKECNAYQKLINLIVSEGEYYSDSNYYSYSLGISSTSNGSYYSRSALYYPEKDELSITMLYNSYYISIEIVEEATAYEYWLLYSDDYMTGSIYPYSFSDSTTYLYYSSTNISSSLRTSYSKLGCSMAKLLLTCLNLDLSDVGITAKDLGFINF